MNNIQPEQPASRRIVLYQCTCLVLYLKNLLEKTIFFLQVWRQEQEEEALCPDRQACSFSPSLVPQSGRFRGLREAFPVSSDSLTNRNYRITYSVYSSKCQLSRMTGYLIFW